MNDIDTAGTAPIRANPLRHSGLGIAAFAIGLVCGALILITIVVAAVQVAHDGGAGNQGLYMAVGLAIILLLLVCLVGIGLGIAALLQRERKRLFGVLGLCINLALVLGTIALIIVGNAIK